MKELWSLPQRAEYSRPITWNSSSVNESNLSWTGRCRSFYLQWHACNNNRQQACGKHSCHAQRKPQHNVQANCSRSGNIHNKCVSQSHWTPREEKGVYKVDSTVSDWRSVCHNLQWWESGVKTLFSSLPHDTVDDSCMKIWRFSKNDACHVFSFLLWRKCVDKAVPAQTLFNST